jgi:death on curing protein
VAIDFLQIEDVLQIQEDQVMRYGGMPGVKNIGMLKSALAQPSATFDGKFLHADIFHRAAAYLFHLCEDHPFHDGNKRTAVVSCLIFLDLNGYTVTAAENDLEMLVWDVANRKINKDQIRTFLHKHSAKNP